MSKTVGALVFGVIFVIVGYVVAFHFGKPIVDKAKASVDWPSVDGVVKRSEVVDSRNSDGKTMYSAEVAYAYSVDGKEFKCNTVFFGGDYSSSSSGGAYKITNRYPAGKEVKVYHEPGNPPNAVLEPGAKMMTYLVYGIGLLFFVIGLLVVVGPLCYIAFGAVVIGGAATGAIGRRRRPSRADFGPPPTDFGPPRQDAPPTQRPGPPRRDDDADDGFDVG